MTAGFKRLGKAAFVVQSKIKLVIAASHHVTLESWRISTDKGHSNRMGAVAFRISRKPASTRSIA